MQYPTVEHAFQAAKTLDLESRRLVALAQTPGEAKRLGRNLILRSDWESLKIGVMRKCLRLKFENIELRQKLIDTGDEELVEGNNHGDKFWGICNSEGHNNLGKLLMELRNTL